jgi:hypothetical protein
MEMGRGFVRLEGNDSEARDHLEVAHIGGRNPVAKLERRDTDQQVGEGHTDALGSILAVDLTGPESHRRPATKRPTKTSSLGMVSLLQHAAICRHGSAGSPHSCTHVEHEKKTFFS